MSEAHRNHLAAVQQQALVRRKVLTTLVLSDLPQAEPALALYPAWRSHVNRQHVRDLAAQGSLLWAATSGGVVRWQLDGPRVKYSHYASEHGLPGNAFERIAVDGKGYPWVGGHRVGLSYFDGMHWQILDNRILPSSDILCLDVDTEGYVWAGTAAGLGHLDWSGKQAWWHSFDLSTSPLPSPEIHALAVDRARGLWLGTMWGLYGYSFEADAWQHLTQRDGLPDNVISCLRFAPDGALWVGTVRGASILREGQMQPVPGISGAVRAIAFEPDTGTAWLVAGEHLWHGCDGAWMPIAEALLPIQPGRAEVVAVGGAGRVWAGFQTGLVQSVPEMWRALSAPQPGEMLASGIHALALDAQDHVWAGSAAGLWIYDHGAWRCCRPDNEIEFSLESITQIVASPKGEVWVGSWSSSEYGGLRRFVGTIEFPIRVDTPASIDALTADAQGNLWAASGEDVWHFDGETWQIVTALPASGMVAQVLFVTEGGVLWLGTQAGLYRYADGVWSEWLSEIEVNALAQTADGVLWVGTSEGLWQLHNESAINLWEQSAALPSQEIMALATAPEGGLWIGTMAGLALFDGEALAIWNTGNSGLTHNHILALAAARQGVWIGTGNGVSWFNIHQPEATQ